MIGQILKYGKSYAAIEQAEKNCFTFLKLVQKKKELQILQRESVNSREKTFEILKSQKHFFLILNDEQVLSKKVSFLHDDEKVIVRNAFPSINISDFYFEVYSNHENSFVAITRKKVINKIISDYREKGVCIVDFSLGNFVIKNISSFIKSQKVFTSNTKLSFDNNHIQNIEKQEVVEQEYLINDLKVSNKEILPLSGIISYYSQNASSLIHNQLKEKYLQKKIFDIGLKVGLGFLLLVVLINFFIFTSYRDQMGNLSGELQISKTYKSQLNKLQNEVTQKKGLVESIYSASNLSLSKYFDEIGSSIPLTSLLTQIHFQPKQGVQKKDKSILFKENKIVVKGVSKNDGAFSNWISLLEKKKWIKEVSIIAYGKGKRTISSSNFEFIITIND